MTPSRCRGRASCPRSGSEPATVPTPNCASSVGGVSSWKITASSVTGSSSNRRSPWMPSVVVVRVEDRRPVVVSTGGGRRGGRRRDHRLGSARTCRAVRWSATVVVVLVVVVSTSSGGSWSASIGVTLSSVGRLHAAHDQRQTAAGSATRRPRLTSLMAPPLVGGRRTGRHRPGRSSTHASPPRAAACSATSARPRPVPIRCRAALPRAKRSKIRAPLAGGDAGTLVLDRHQHGALDGRRLDRDAGRDRRRVSRRSRAGSRGSARTGPGRPALPACARRCTSIGRSP